MAGKGSTRRPMTISQDEFNKNWEMAFGNIKTSNKRPELMDRVKIIDDELVYIVVNIIDPESESRILTLMNFENNLMIRRKESDAMEIIKGDINEQNCLSKTRGFCG